MKAETLGEAAIRAAAEADREIPGLVSVRFMKRRERIDIRVAQVLKLPWVIVESASLEHENARL
jgi:hypothetical protein